MGNMSYCRFHNTAQDLQDCYNNMDDRDLSPEEKRARKRILLMCKDICDEYLDENGEIPEEEETED